MDYPRANNKNNNNVNNNNNFARTCSRLSQFLKERRRSLGDQSRFTFPPMAPPLPSPTKLDSKRAEEELGKKKSGMSLFPPKSNQISEGNNGSGSGGPGENLMSLDLFPLPSPSSTKESPKATANTRELPRAKEESKSKSKSESESRNASMTIFYDGKVLVFNDFPEEKIQEIMAMATQQGIIKSTDPETQSQSEAEAEAEANKIPASPKNKNKMATQDNQDAVSDESGGPSDLPIARRTSLFRFMEKRKDRIASAAPYQVQNSSAGMANSNPQSNDALMRNLSQQQPELQKQQQQQLDLKL